MLRTMFFTFATADTSHNGLGAHPKMFGLNTLTVQYLGHFFQGGIGAAVMVGAAVDEHYFHLCFLLLGCCFLLSVGLNRANILNNTEKNRRVHTFFVILHRFEYGIRYQRLRNHGSSGLT